MILSIGMLGCSLGTTWSVVRFSLDHPVRLPFLPASAMAPLAMAEIAKAATRVREVTVRTCASEPAASIARMISRAAARHSLDLRMLRSVVARESANQTCATSPKGAAGLMQLMPATAKHFGVRDVYNPEENIEAGARYLKLLLKRYDNDLPRALAAYNAGPRIVDARETTPHETVNYVKGIMKQLADSPLAPSMPIAQERP